MAYVPPDPGCSPAVAKHEGEATRRLPFWNQLSLGGTGEGLPQRRCGENVHWAGVTALAESGRANPVGTFAGTQQFKTERKGAITAERATPS